MGIYLILTYLEEDASMRLHFPCPPGGQGKWSLHGFKPPDIGWIKYIAHGLGRFLTSAYQGDRDDPRTMYLPYLSLDRCIYEAPFSLSYGAGMVFYHQR